MILSLAPSRGFTMAKTQTTPKGEEIPIPKRGDFFSDLKKAAAPDRKSPRGPKKK
jgi:hypothetical protein